MIVKMNNGMCEINIKSNKVNTIVFSSTSEKDEFLYSLYDIFKVKHKRSLWNNYVSITDDDFESVEPKSYDIFTLHSDFNNLDDDKEFQKLLSKYISTLDSNNETILQECREIQSKLVNLLYNISSEIEFVNLVSDDKSIPLSQLLKSVDIKCVSNELREYNTYEAKIKYLDLMMLVSQKNKEQMFIILYPEAGIGISDQKKVLEKINKIEGTVIIITNSPTFLSYTKNFDCGTIVAHNYKKLSLEYCVDEMRKLDRNREISSIVNDIIFSIINPNSPNSQVIMNILFN